MRISTEDLLKALFERVPLPLVIEHFQAKVNREMKKVNDPSLRDQDVYEMITS